MDKLNNTKSNFGLTGWYYIIYTAILFYFCTGLVTDGLNVSIAQYVNAYGWEQPTLLNFSTWGGYISIALTPFLAALLNKIGTRLMLTITLVISGAATIWWGLATTPAQYLIACALVMSFSNAYAHLGGTNLANSWFPKKKGLFLGWSTMGLQLSSVLFVPMLSLLFTYLGLQGAYILLGAAQIICAVLAFFTVKNTPQEAGKYPDNIPMTDEELANYTAAENSYTPKWSYKRILTNPHVWLIGISFGILYMASIGLLSQWVPRLISLGFPEGRAILMLSIAAAIGLFGSYAWGWLDMKLGPKKASVGIMLNYVLALIIVILPFNTILLYLDMFLIGMGIGGVANLVGSLVGTIWGHKEFPKVFGVINTIEGVVRVSAFSVLAFGLTKLGGYTGAYMIFLGLAIIGVIMMLFVREKPYSEDMDQ